MHDDDNIQTDTSLSDLAEFLQSRKKDRQQTIKSTEVLSQYILKISLCSSGFLIGKWLLFIGGSSHLLLACTLCFSIGCISTLNTSNLVINYTSDWEITNAESVFKILKTGLGSSCLTITMCKDFMHIKSQSDVTIKEIKEDIRQIESKDYWQTNASNISILVIILLLVLSVWGKINATR